MSDEQVRAFLTPFTTRSWIVHLLGILVGVGLWGAVYLAVLGDPALAAAGSPAALAARQTGMAVAGAAAGLYFGVCYTRAIGGPGLDALVPILAILVVPPVASVAAGGFPENLWTSAPSVLSPRLLVVALRVGLPEAATFLAVLLGWVFVGLGSRAAVDEWMAEHTTDSYREHVVGDDP